MRHAGRAALQNRFNRFTTIRLVVVYGFCRADARSGCLIRNDVASRTHAFLHHYIAYTGTPRECSPRERVFALGGPIQVFSSSYRDRESRDFRRGWSFGEAQVRCADIASHKQMFIAAHLLPSQFPNHRCVLPPAQRPTWPPVILLRLPMK
jgi:hypothetical protein